MSVTERHQCVIIPVKVVANTCASAPIDLRKYEDGTILIPPALDSCNIAFLVAHDSTVYNPTAIMSDENGIMLQVQCLSMGMMAYIPQKVLSAPFASLWCEAAGAPVNQSADRLFYLALNT